MKKLLIALLLLPLFLPAQNPTPVKVQKFVTGTLAQSWNVYTAEQVNSIIAGIPVSLNNFLSDASFNPTSRVLTLQRSGLSDLYVTIPSGADGNNYLTGGSFASNVLTLKRSGLPDLQISIPVSATIPQAFAIAPSSTEPPEDATNALIYFFQGAVWIVRPNGVRTILTPDY